MPCFRLALLSFHSIFYIALLLWGNVSILFSQYAYFQAAESHLLYLNLEDANKEISKIPLNSFQYFYLKHHLFFYENLLMDFENSALFFKRSDSLLNLYQQSANKIANEYTALLAEMYLERSFVYFFKKSYWETYKNFKNAYKYCYLNNEKQTLYFSYRARGICELMIASIPSEYQWIAQLLGYKADAKQGLYYLSLAAQKSEFLKQETLILQALARKHLHNDHESPPEIISQILNKYPDSPLLHYLYGLFLLDKKQTKQAKSYLLQAIQFKRGKNFFYPYYHLANCYLYEQQWDSASFHFHAFLKKNTQNFKPEVYFKLGMMAVFQKQTQQANTYFQKVLSFDKPTAEKDNYSQKIASIFLSRPPSEIESTLFKSRYLYDGGYYRQSLNLLLKELNRLKTYPPENQIEIYYRLAKNYQELKDKVLAKLYYRLAIDAHWKVNIWFKPYAALNIAQIYEEEKDFRQARFFYQKALSYKNYDFQNSLQQKAKTRLAQLPSH